jgi:PAS domain S-box-containing protein
VTGNFSAPRVLVVDDVGEMRALIGRALSARGYRVDVAASLAQARALDPAGYDAVLIDAGLGSEHGVDLIEALRSADPAAAGRCLVITGGTADLLPDGVGRLTKPFQIAELLEAVHALQQVSPPTTASPPAAPSSPAAAAGRGGGAARPASAQPNGRQPAAAEPAAWHLLRLIRRLRARERRELVDFLHDGPIQELTAASLELQAMARSAGPGLAPRLAATLRQLDTAASSLRWLVDGHWPFLLPETRLADAIRQRTAWLLAAPVTVQAGGLPAGLSPAEITVIADVVELMLLAVLPASPHLQAQVAVQSGAAEIEVELALTAGHAELAASDPAAAREALDDLAAALGATAHSNLGDRRWRARIMLPRQAGTTPFKKLMTFYFLTITWGVNVKYLDDHRSVALLEAAPDAMICVAADGRIALVNAQAERLFGYQRDELAGQPIEILVPDGARAVHPEHRARYMADLTPRLMGAGLELSGRRRDGSTFPAEISLAAIDTDEGIVVTAAVRDVTERRQLQAERERLKSQGERERLEGQLHQAQRLESLGQLAGGVAHDFNNLLGVISNYAAFVSEEVAKDPPQVQWAAVRADIEQVERAAQRAAVLTHQLLSFARREVVQPRVLSLNEMILDVEQLLVHTLGEHIELVTSLAPDLGPVLADGGQIEQVLVNLAVNARDAMQGGGMLTLETANTHVDEAYATHRANLAPGRYVSLKVSDTGVGIPKDVIERVFEPFFTTKPKGEGSGLGLATVYGIITQAGGTVRIYSEPGFGTTLTVLLPITAQTDLAAQPPAQEFDGGGEVVLIVEDEPAMREVTRRMLVRSGYQVLSVATGSEAVDIVSGQQRHVDVLLTDVVMPKMLGREVADRVRDCQPTVRVLYMSGYTQGLLSAQEVLESRVCLIEKPFAKRALLAKLREVLAGPA